MINLVFLSHSARTHALPDLERFGSHVLSKQVMDWVSDSELQPPYLKGHGFSSWGKRTDELVTSEGWRKLQDIGFQEG